MTTLIATHSGSFHADDVFGVAVLAALYPDHRIVRTRDPQEIAPADFVVDVGGVWDAERGRFDHHQRGFGGARMRTEADGSTAPAEGYASAGLVWRAFGLAYVQRFAAQMECTLDEAALSQVAEDVDASLVRYLDLVDTGAQEVAPGIFGLSSQIALLNSTWLEEAPLDRAGRAHLQVERFGEAMALARRLLDRFLLRRIGQTLAADKVRASQRLFGGRVLHLADGGLPWTRVVVEEMPDVLLVVYPEESSGQHQIRTVPVTLGSFDSRMDLPAAWAGLREGQLAGAIGVPDAVFCHSNLFIAGARSLEGAMRMAGMALGISSRT
ncbi:MYG1 family protein [Ramlibacter sp.]|uniref:MYG1 family protein n=1 Tax=Ramlibacter sp. TaxID=1917967 RepID=UPI002622A941|nr:MYG1 family protein [Ramlibacter sp.]MDB5953935.1 hypothetical protein [Ramlibacter sp.]